jgi:Zn-dependent protease with chaperone function
MSPGVNEMNAREIMRQFIHQASQLFYGGDKPTVFGMQIVPEIVPDPSNVPNGNLSPAGAGMGIAASAPLMNLNNKVARDFAIGHELGHGFTEQVLRLINMQITGAQDEVIADLTSAYLLNQMGISWNNLLTSLGSASGQIFDNAWSGHHPPAAIRIGYIRQLVQSLNTHSFEDAFKDVLGQVQQKP